MKNSINKVEIGSQVGVVLNLETEQYEPVFKEVPSEGGEVIKVAKVKKAVKKPVKRVATGIQEDRHLQIVQVLETFGANEYKRNDFLEVAEKLFGKAIPFNKKVREVYSKKVGGAYIRSEVV